MIKLNEYNILNNKYKYKYNIYIYKYFRLLKNKQKLRVYFMAINSQLLYYRENKL